MYEVRCGIKLDHWDKGQVFGSQKKFNNMNKAKQEVNILLDTAVKGIFKNVTYNDLIEIDENYKAWYENSSEYYLKARMDGKILDEDNEGEFYIEIIELNNQLN